MAFDPLDSFESERGLRAASNDLVRDEGHRVTLISAAKDFLISRRSRASFLDESIFGEPGWDMLLALYITEETEARNSIAKLTEFSGAPPTTALRWIDHLGRLGLIRRLAHPTDLRTAFIELTDEGRYALDRYFTRILAMAGEGKR